MGFCMLRSSAFTSTEMIASWVNQRGSKANATTSRRRSTKPTSCDGGSSPQISNGIALQTLIVERFNLRYHREPRISSVYVMSIAKGGPRIKQAKLAADAHGAHMFYPLEPGNMQSHSTYMWQLIEELENQLNCIVRDETGLEGTYDYTLEWTPDDQAHAESSGPSLFTALKEQLGLKLEMQKRPVDVVVIDHIERPSPN